MLEPGKYVQWQAPYGVAWGRIVERRRGRLLIVANGAGYEIDPATDILRCVPACAHCGRPTRRPDSTYCSRRCRWLAIRADSDERVFDAIVEYKRQNDGLSPSLDILERLTGLARVTICTKILPRLVKAGLIRQMGKNNYRGIIVTGGKWTFEEQQS